MTAQHVRLEGGWTAFQGVNGDDAAANTATTDLINVLDTVEVPIVVLGRDFTIVCFNNAAADLLGLSPSDIGRASRDILALAGLPHLEQQGGDVIASGVASRTDFRDGDKWFVVRMSPYIEGDRHIAGTVLTFTDVTAFRASIAQAIYERECTKVIVNTVADPLVVLSADQRIQSGNRAFYTMFGISREETQGVPLYELENGAFELVPLRKELEEMLAGSSAFQPVEVDHVSTAKGQRTLIVDAHPLSFPGHSEHRILVTFQDITERKQAEAAKDLRSEEELRRSAAKIRRLVEANVVGIVMFNLEGAITSANEAFLHMVQYRREEVDSGRVRWNDLTPAEWRDRDERAIAELNATGVCQPFEKEYFRKDGGRVPVLLGGALFEGSGSEGVAFILDLSEQKRAEGALRRSEAFLAEGQRLGQIGTFSWRPATGEITWSEQLYRIYELEIGVPVTLELIRTRVHPEDVSLIEKMKLVDEAGGGNGFEWHWRLVMPDRSIKYLYAVAHVTRDQDGQLEYIAAVQDVTARRLSEQALEKARSELANVARVMSLGTLTASIAHELNQPLSGIITNASTCLRMLGADPPNVDAARETARRTIRDGNRAADVIARLRTLYSKKDFSPESMDLNEAAREVIALSLSDLQRHRVIMQHELAEDLPSITGDRIQLQQVILNLLRNASDAMSKIDDRPRELLVRTERDEGDRVRLSVKDVGVGFEPQAADKLFEAFYTTKSDGMGIGLSISRSIIEAHHGRLWATANDGPGATFSFAIPCRLGALADTETRANRADRAKDAA